MDIQRNNTVTASNVHPVTVRFGRIGIVLAVLLFSLRAFELDAAVTISVDRANRTVKLYRNTDFGVSNANGIAMPQGGMIAVEISPEALFDSTYRVNVPVSQIGNMTDTVDDNGTITKPLATSSVTYVWRVNISGGTAAERTAARTQLLSNLIDEHVFSESLGGSTGYLTHTSIADGKLRVTVLEESLGSTTANPSYVWRNMSLIIDLNNVRYSGSYTGTMNATILCPGLIN
jgi:hypothetical protein